MEKIIDIEIPRLKRTILTERITFAATPEMKKDLEELKKFENIDTSALIRNLIEQFLKTKAC